MLMLPPGAKVFLATERVDGRKGINGLSTLVRSQFTQDPMSGQLFVFFSRRADQVRVLYWDRDGYILTTKRLEVGLSRDLAERARTRHARGCRAAARPRGHRPHACEASPALEPTKATARVEKRLTRD